MKTEVFARILEQTAADDNLSRSEARALRDRLKGLDVARLRALRRQVFAAARQRLIDPQSKATLAWTEELVEALDKARPEATRGAGMRKVLMAPHDDIVGWLRRLIKGARDTLDICVYTVTDDRLSRPLVEAHARGIAVRLLTETDKADDLGSDIDDLARVGIKVRMDTSDDALMHHKFMLVDGDVLATGSYNWTRSASKENHENLIITDDPALAAPFAEEFERLWKRHR